MNLGFRYQFQVISAHHVNEQDGSMNVDDEGAEAEGGEDS